MDPGIRARWVAALRSGEYEQARKVLRSGDAYCCLGVLCELAVADGVIPPAERNRLDGSWLYDEYDTELPESVMEWARLEQTNPILRMGNELLTLAGLNDGLGAEDDEHLIIRAPWSFARIADVIEGGAS